MDKTIDQESLHKIAEGLYEIKQTFRSDMLVPARFYATDHMITSVLKDKSLLQLVNVSTLPGIQKYALAMPDMHEGYGFPIGGVAAMDIDDGGVISPGGIGYDINCGVRLLSTNLSLKKVAPKLKSLVQKIFNAVPSGVGRDGKIKLNKNQLHQILNKGALSAVKMGYGNDADLETCEEGGFFNDAQPDLVSEHAKNRGINQLGTLGSGNHFLELQVVDEIFDEEVSKAFNLRKGHVTAMVHCGSRGLGHQVCSDYVRIMLSFAAKENFNLIDRQLACVPFLSHEGEEYFLAMKAAANFAWANRHVIGHFIKNAFFKTFHKHISISTVYDVAHNIGKLEKHKIHNKEKNLIVHRKGATRAFGPHAQDLPNKYKNTGQPVLIPGTMGTASYVLCGTQEGMKNAFGSACHGAGRAMSRRAAKKKSSGQKVREELIKSNIMVFSDSNKGLSEEAPYAYKDINEVIEAIVLGKLAKKVARLKPIAVIKGN